MAYQSEWLITEPALVRRERWPGIYGAKYTPLVYPEQKILADQPVLRLQKADPLKHGSSLPTTEIILAGLNGRVLQITPRGGVIIESHATLLRGAIGIGRQVAGVLTLWSPDRDKRRPLTPGALLVVPGPINFAFLHHALASGVSAVIASSIATSDLEGFFHTDLVQLLTCTDIERIQVHFPPISVFLIEGPGTAAMPLQVLDLFRQYQGTRALLSALTCPHRGIFPELAISLM